MMMLVVRGSSPRWSIRSPQPTSSIEPTETKALKPTLARKLQSSTAVQRAPLWLRKPMLPGRAMAPAKVAFRPVAGFIRPGAVGEEPPAPPPPRLLQDAAFQLEAPGP